ncbi:MAG: bifunctional enoyl-CoA hydratase/phosphate acetyltransferase [Planctomycetes bacterium]|nr:bifunctional enoyl-CoA hydratase/phosphate acetyltransferase [Planctomycetota bacterium]
MENFDQLLETVREQPSRKVAVAVGQDPTVIQAVAEARKQCLAEVVLVGDEAEIRKAAELTGESLAQTPIVHEADPIKATGIAVRMVTEGQADILMKGFIHTDDFLRGLLDKEHGLRTGSIMSHVFIAEIRDWKKLIFITDGAMNIAPNLEQKAAILLNAVYLAGLFGVAQPNVAALAAVELVNPKMPATLDAAALGKLADRGQYVPGCTVDGPFGLDNAVSIAAARHKKITGSVAGQADILVVPDIESGNMLAKSMVYFGGHRMIGLLVGAKVPVVLTSRADSAESKLLSIAGAVLMVNRERALKLKIGKVHY